MCSLHESEPARVLQVPAGPGRRYRMSTVCNPARVGAALHTTAERDFKSLDSLNSDLLNREIEISAIPMSKHLLQISNKTVYARYALKVVKGPYEPILNMTELQHKVFYWHPLKKKKKWEKNP